jgi:hypothetical protein
LLRSMGLKVPPAWRSLKAVTSFSNTSRRNFLRQQRPQGHTCQHQPMLYPCCTFICPMTFCQADRSYTSHKATKGNSTCTSNSSTTSTVCTTSTV